MEKKAKFIKALYDRNPLNKHAWEHTDLLYEYKGHQYIVTKHNNGYAFDSLRKQHEEEQRRIDEMIERRNQSITEWKYEGSAQEGFDVFWNYVEGSEFEPKKKG